MVARKIFCQPSERTVGRRKKKCHLSNTSKGLPNHYHPGDKLVTQSCQTDNTIDFKINHHRQRRYDGHQSSSSSTPSLPSDDRVDTTTTTAIKSSLKKHHDYYSKDDNRFYDRTTPDCENKDMYKLEKLQLLSSTDEDIKKCKINVDHLQSRYDNKLNDSLDTDNVSQDLSQDNSNQEIPTMKKSRSLELLSLHHYHFSYSNRKGTERSPTTTTNISRAALYQTKKTLSSSPAIRRKDSKSSVRSLTRSPCQADIDHQNNEHAVLPPLIKKHMEEGPTLEWESEIDYNDNIAGNSSLYYLPIQKYDENTTSNDNNDTDSAPCDSHMACNSNASSTDWNLQSSKSKAYHTDDSIHDIKTQSPSYQMVNDATDCNSQSSHNIISSNLNNRYTGSDINLASSCPPSLDSQLEAISLNGSMKGAKINHLQFNHENDNVKLYQSLTNSREKIGKHYYQDPVFVVHDWQEYHNQVAKYFHQYRQSSLDQFDHLQHDTASIRTT